MKVGGQVDKVRCCLKEWEGGPEGLGGVDTVDNLSFVHFLIYWLSAVLLMTIHDFLWILYN
jgi:hypothetical protein